jgi:Ala-tRNA(Pro) deacylase
MGIFENVKKMLDEKGVEYEIVEHEPVRTSEEAAKVRGTKLGQV